MKTRAVYGWAIACLFANSIFIPVITFALPDTPEQRAGEISRLIPAVNIMRSGESIAAGVKTPVYWQDVVSTLASGRARVSLDDGSVLNLGSDSNLRVAKHDAVAQQTELAMGLGKVRLQAQKISKPGGKFEVRTPAGVAGVIGTDFYVSYDNNLMSVIVFEGRVKVCNLAGVCLEVGAGMMTTVHSGDSSGPAEPTQTPPSILSTAMGSTGTEAAAQAVQAENAPLGIVTRAFSARIGNSAAADGATIYSGDYLSTESGGVLLARVGSLTVELQGGSAAHIYRAGYGAVVELTRGSVVYKRPGTQPNVVIVASDVRITPVISEPSSGRVSVDDPCRLTVQSERGQVYVQVGSDSHLVNGGQAFRVRPEVSVISRKSLSPDADDYHEAHEHQPCAAPSQAKWGRSPLPASQSRFLYVAGSAVVVLTVLPLIESFESPNRP